MIDEGLIEMIILWLLFELSFELNIKLLRKRAITPQGKLKVFI
jgi:hypothetical protein